MPKGKIDVSFVYEKETKNTFRFQEQLSPGVERGVIGTLYVMKETFKGSPPKKLIVTLEWPN